MKKFEKFEIEKKALITGGNFGDPTGYEDVHVESTTWHGIGESGTDGYSSEWGIVYY